MSPQPERKEDPNWKQVRKGFSVTYHGEAGDVDAEIVSFNGVGQATLLLKDGTELLHVPEGEDPGEWSSPLRKKPKKED